MATDRPNIIFILCDDLGPGDLGILWQNQRQTKQKFATPQLDTFAQEGMILSRHYCAAPVCAPARGSLLTGRHQGHCGIRNSQFDKALPDEHTLGTVMRQAGYATAAFGKWGLQGGKYRLKWPGQRGDRSPELEPGHPLLRGFDYFYGYTGHVDGHYHYPLKGNRPMYDGYKDVTDGLAKCYTTDLFTARTKKWIVDHHKAHPKQPFFTYLGFDTPHAPQQVPTTSHLTAKSNYPAGGGLTGGIQWNEGGKGGGNSGPHRGAKFSLYEGGLRIPAIISWPGHIPENQVRGQFATGCDWYPTILELCGISATKHRLDGKSLTPIIKSADTPTAHKTFHWKLGSKLAVRQGKWKMVVTGKKIELYDIPNDLGEAKNLAGKFPEVVTQLQQSNQEYWQSITQKEDATESGKGELDPGGPSPDRATSSNK
jgi:arylsulfatase A-like enzyme